MQTWEAITSRRNVRSFADRPVTDEQLDRIMEAARRSPSSQNTQPWDLVVVTDRRLLSELSKVAPGAVHVAGSAATIALITDSAADQLPRVRFDLGQLTMSIMLAAADLGIGSGHAGVGDKALAARLLGLPPDKSCTFMIALGYPADRPLAPVARPDRRPLGQLVHRDRW
jgi:nitroreductase